MPNKELEEAIKKAQDLNKQYPQYPFIVVKINDSKMTKTAGGTYSVECDPDGNIIYENRYQVIDRNALRNNGAFPYQIVWPEK